LTGIVYTFLTHENASPRTFGLVVDQRRDGDCAFVPDIPALAQMANAQSGACAYGKIAIVTSKGIHTYQVTEGGLAEAVFCGNSTAAALKARGVEQSEDLLLFGAAAGPYLLKAAIDGDNVTQSWTFPAPAVETGEWLGRRVLFVRAVNDYAILLGGLPEATDPEAVRRDIVGSDLACKLAVVSDPAGAPTGEPVVEFFNSNGQHGDAPLTGLAAFALAALSDAELNSLFPAGELRCATANGPRTVSLPGANAGKHAEVTLEFRSVNVNLEPIETEVTG